MNRRLQFTLRSLLVAMLVVAWFSAWIEQQMQIVRERQFEIASEAGVPGFFVIAKRRTGGQPIDVPWLRRQLGDRTVTAIIYYPRLDHQRGWLRKVKRLFPEAKVIEREPWYCRS